MRVQYGVGFSGVVLTTLAGVLLRLAWLVHCDGIWDQKAYGSIWRNVYPFALGGEADIHGPYGTI